MCQSSRMRNQSQNVMSLAFDLLHSLAVGDVFQQRNGVCNRAITLLNHRGIERQPYCFTRFANNGLMNREFTESTVRHLAGDSETAEERPLWCMICANVTGKRSPALYHLMSKSLRSSIRSQPARTPPTWNVDRRASSLARRAARMN
jgi:hypothetical protein